MTQRYLASSMAIITGSGRACPAMCVGRSRYLANVTQPSVMGNHGVANACPSVGQLHECRRFFNVNQSAGQV